MLRWLKKSLRRENLVYERHDVAQDEPSLFFANGMFDADERHASQAGHEGQIPHVQNKLRCLRLLDGMAQNVLQIVRDDTIFDLLGLDPHHQHIIVSNGRDQIINVHLRCLACSVADGWW